ncbi:MAG: hypothetical protein P1P64_05445 [Treponemataceae bacterium]
MSSFDEQRAEILAMLKDGKISVEDAEKLLDAISGTASKSQNVKSGGTKLSGKILRIKAGMDDENENVEVSVPASLLRFTNVFSQNVPNCPDIDIDELEKMIESGAVGEIMSVKQNGKPIVKIFVE